MVEMTIAIILSVIISSMVTRLYLDHKQSSDIGTIVIDKDLVYLAFYKGHGPDELTKLNKVELDVTHK